MIDAKNKCRYFPECGGCLYLDLDEESYQNKKREIFFDAFKRYSKTFLNIENISRFKWIGPGSRRRLSLKVDNKNNIGFHKKLTNEIIRIDKCYIAESDISSTISELQTVLYQFENFLITEIVITKFDNIVDIIFKCKRELNISQQNKLLNFAKINKINLSVNIGNKFQPLIINSKPKLKLINNLTLNLNPDIFVQATKLGEEIIAKIIYDFIINNFNKKISLIDIYAGYGSYSFMLSNLASKISCFEGVESMINIIKSNISSNSISNIFPALRDLYLYPVSEGELNKFDLAILNPPRNGAMPQVKMLTKSLIKNFIYVSCNPETFARDSYYAIENGFKIEQITVLDQFFGSKHLELISIFKK